MEKVRPWCVQPSDRGRLKNRTVWRRHRCELVTFVRHACQGLLTYLFRKFRSDSNRVSSVPSLILIQRVVVADATPRLLQQLSTMLDAHNAPQLRRLNLNTWWVIKATYAWCGLECRLKGAIKLLFWKKMPCCGNVILYRLEKCCDASIFALAAKFHIEPMTLFVLVCTY